MKSDIAFAKVLLILLAAAILVGLLLSNPALADATPCTLPAQWPD